MEHGVWWFKDGVGVGRRKAHLPEKLPWDDLRQSLAKILLLSLANCATVGPMDLPINLVGITLVWFSKPSYRILTFSWTLFKNNPIHILLPKGDLT